MKFTHYPTPEHMFFNTHLHELNLKPCKRILTILRVHSKVLEFVNQREDKMRMKLVGTKFEAVIKVKYITKTKN